jgi:hypothetical protein
MLLLIAAVALAVTSVQATPTVTLTWAPNHSTDAGEFIMTPNSGPTFDTFCVELSQYVTIGNTYTYVVSPESDGGIHGPAPVALGTAWLYENFLNNTLSGFTGTFGNQTDLQNAIWYFQGELSSLSGDPYVALADAAVGGNTAALANGNGAYGIDIWNLYNPDGSEAQSQLGSVPEHGTMLVSLAMLLPLGLLRMKSLFPTA